MDSARWQQIQKLFHHAADLPASQREDFLKSGCGEDELLISEVRAMLEQDADGSSLLDQPLPEIAHQTLANSFYFSKDFGPFQLVRLLGEGGMGVVYLAERKNVGGKVAIKVLRDAWLSPARRERFAAEQRTLAQLNHPSIAHLYDAATLDDGTPYFVMEYVEGTPLTQYCREHRYSVEECLKLFRSVCEAVQYAHSQAVIHRDLKPSNILVKSDGSIRLLDFGIAKQVESLDLPVDQTTMGFRLMTPAYAAPEQVRGERIGLNSDVYSLGVILYELLTGQLPFDLSNLTPAEAATVIAEHEPAKPSIAVRRETPSQANANALSLNQSAWADLDVLCLTAMHKDPTRRYRSVEGLIRDVDHYLKGEPLEAQPDAISYRLRKFVSRNRRPVMVAATVAVFVVGLVIFFTVRLARERDYANRQTAAANAVNQFLADDLLGRGNPFQSGKADETLFDAIQQASPSIDRKFADEPEVAARLHLTIAQALDNRSSFPEARKEYEHAHQLFLQTEGPLSQNAIAVQLQRASMEARSFQSGGIPTAKSLVAQQEQLISQIKSPRKDLQVWLFTAKGMIALVESDAKSANQYFGQAVNAAAKLPDFDPTAQFNLKQRLAFTYIRLGDGATAERLARELIADLSRTQGPDSPYVLRVKLNLAQAYMVQRNFKEAIDEANAIYPDFLTKFGPDHQLTMQLLTTRAQSEGSLGLFDDSVRDDLAIHDIALKKQGPLSFYAIATLSDAAEAQCRAGHLVEGERNARTAHDDAVQAFGPQSGLASGIALPLANCLIGLGKLQEASQLLANVNIKAASQLTGDPDWGAGVTLAQAEIAVRQADYAQAEKYLASVHPIFSRPDAEAYQRRKMDELSEMTSSRLRTN
jgi:eukaryotic-like serine/threonine-protein kinase